MMFLVFYFLLSAVLFFQGLHLSGEVTQPLGTLPEEVGQAPEPSKKWGAFLMTYGTLAAAVGLAGFQWPFFVPARPAVIALGGVVLAVYALWLLFAARKVEFIGKPSADHGDHGHGHH
ncbi:MAG TPA: hypothetical protein VJ623_01800 [Holophagaceae bacterium]|nr:hypothetical protein [Holophagaceae bacterium]HJW33070.1 hypothetical protein [Holophagaceae bacterium]